VILQYFAVNLRYVVTHEELTRTSLSFEVFTRRSMCAGKIVA
jgi:hypothetical protein